MLLIWLLSEGLHMNTAMQVRSRTPGNIHFVTSATGRTLQPISNPLRKRHEGHKLSSIMETSEA